MKRRQLDLDAVRRSLDKFPNVEVDNEGYVRVEEHVVNHNVQILFILQEKRLSRFTLQELKDAIDAERDSYRDNFGSAFEERFDAEQFWKDYCRPARSCCCFC